MNLEFYFKKSSKSIEGLLTVAVKDSDGIVDESKSIRDILVRSGAPGFQGTEGVLGKSPIPDGNYWLWNIRKYIMQYDDLDAINGEIGRFYPISSSKDNRHLIQHEKGNRNHIGLHDENSFRGSSGCVVIVNNGTFRRVCSLMEEFEKEDAKFKFIVWTD